MDLRRVDECLSSECLQNWFLFELKLDLSKLASRIFDEAADEERARLRVRPRDLITEQAP